MSMNQQQSRRVILYYLEGLNDSLPADFSTLPSIELDVDFNDVITIAATELTIALGRPFHIAHYYFVTRPDASGRRSQAAFPTCYVDADGTFKWPHHTLANITFGDLQRTVEQGFLNADPEALVLDNRPFGNGMPVLWTDLFELLLKLGGGIGATYAITKAGRDVAAGARTLGTLLRTRYRKWVGKGALEPTSLLSAVLQRRAWRVSELAQRLGVDQDEANLLLDCLGYAHVSDDLYSRGDKLDKTLASRLIEEYLVTDPADAEREFAEYLAQRRQEGEQDEGR
jgi:hypothetical protein